MKVRGAVVVISGASSGIGEALAEECASRGARAVVMLARRVDRLESVAERVRAKGSQALVVATDVANEEGVRAALKLAVDTFGTVDIVIANAGLGAPLAKEARNTKAHFQVMDINVMGAIRLVEAALPTLIQKQSGQLVAVSSVAGYRGIPTSGSYSASKAALSIWMESYRNELRHKNITVTLIEPGFIKSEMTAKAKFPMPFIQETADAVRVMVDGIERDRKVIVTPWQFRYIMGLARLLPNFLFDPVMTRATPEKMLKLSARSGLEGEPE